MPYSSISRGLDRFGRSPMRILIAEDCPVTRRYLLALVQKWGHEVILTKDGGEAYEVLMRETDISMAILDWEMPEMVGPEICEALQKSGRVVYSILLTGREDAADIAYALNKGASDYVCKPCNPIVLRARVDAGIRLVDMQEEMARMQKLESLGRLSAGLAHEINTPLQYIFTNLGFLEESFADLARVLEAATACIECDPSQITQSIESLRESAEAADLQFLTGEIPGAIAQTLSGVREVSAIVDTMRGFSDLGDGVAKPADVNRAIEEASTLAFLEWKTNGAVEFDLAADLPNSVCSHANLFQALVHLLTNASHAVESACRDREGHTGRIQVSSKDCGELIEIAIDDNGTGMAADVRSRIFDPFFTTKEVGSGKGQGLCYVRRVATECGGSIDVESQVGVGTTFRLRVPRQAA